MSPKPERPPRILICGMNYAPELIGVGRYTGDIGAYLAGQGWDVEVVTAPPHYPGWRVEPGSGRRGYHREDRDGARLFRCPIWLPERMGGINRLLTPLSFALASAPVVLWRAVARRPDVVLAIEPTLLCAPAVLIAAGLVGARSVLHVQDLEVDAAFAVGHLRPGLRRRFALAFERLVLGRFDRVATISRRMAEKLSAKGVASARLAIVRNWVDLDQIRPLEGGDNAFRGELDLPSETFVSLYSGVIGRKQALHIVLAAAERLAGDRRFAFVLAGEGPEKAGLVARFGHLPNLRFLPLQPEARLCELLNLADLHLLPQDRGAADLVLPSKLGGILASGRSLLAMADPGTELHDFLCGAAILIPPGDPEALARAIQAASRRRRGTSQATRALASAFDRRQNLAAFDRLLREACRSPKFRLVTQT